MCAYRFIRSSVPYQPPHSGEVCVIRPTKKSDDKKDGITQTEQQSQPISPSRKRPRVESDEQIDEQKRKIMKEDISAMGVGEAEETTADGADDSNWYCELCEESVSATRDAHERTMAHILSKQFTLGARNWVVYGIEKENVGRRMLRDLGWTEHEGLGKDGAGVKIPIMTRLKPDRKGIGTAGAAPLRVTHTQQEVEHEVARAREQPAVPRFIDSAKKRIQRVKRERHQEQRIREMMMSDSWEYLHQLDRAVK